MEQLYNIIIGVLIAVIVFTIEEWIKNCLEKKKKRKDYKNLLSLIATQIEFEINKLNDLKTDLNNSLNILRTNPGQITFPSYKIYPEHLEYLKTFFVNYEINVDITNRVQVVVFELKHIEFKLAQIRDNLTNNNYLISNIPSLITLINDDIIVIKDHLNEIENKSKELKE